MKLEFTKMHGLGNDMIVIDSLRNGFRPAPEQARKLCDRRFGIGADQILVLLPSASADFRMVTINADGSEVEMCGNGVRCLARYLHDRGLTKQNPLAIETLAGTIRPELRRESVRVDMGEPIFEASQVPVRGSGKIQNVMLSIDDNPLRISALSMGNPHCVVPVEDVAAVPLEELGPRLERHPWFPKRANVEFVQVLARDHLQVRVWERGTGVTLACGTGACAAAVAMMDQELCEREVTVSLPGGDLEIEWDPAGNHVFMTGPAVEVFTGEIGIE